MKYSLIVATLGRYSELKEMLLTIASQKFDLNNIEIIIIDQNQKGFLDEIIQEFDNLNLIHIHSTLKGLSINRNIGLKYCTGDIICFPDDDCKFYDDTLIEVVNILDKDVNIEFCIGQIYDRTNKKDIIRKWPKKEFQVNKFNSYFINSSITLFVKKDFILNFDENLGVGAKFGSCEDADLIYRILENKAKGIYTPRIALWHPEPNYQEISLIKVKNYASGFGYFVRKRTDTVKVFLLILLLCKKIMQLMLNILNHKYQKNYFRTFFSGLIDGLIKNEGINDNSIHTNLQF